ncbi:restriction endonuclease [uncultured Brevibacillus sp.]|uniref:restriction endonuclease n=1 Tax=uncultured Brevibacillus sp. TaxID=169970 RepID=UPI002591E09B|nr:restriction endonuclease [uncultured Brevibacillus sp.]
MMYVLGVIIILILVVFSFLIRNRTRQSKILKINIFENQDLKSITIENIDLMEDGSEFEEYLLRLFLALGYNDAYKTVGSHDFGADLVFSDSNGIRNVIQAKRYNSDSSIGIDAVQQIYAARNYYQAKKAVVIGTTKYTDSSDTLAGVNGVLLLDRNDLIEIITAFKYGNYEEARIIIEREPRVIYEFWDNKDRTFEIKKDKKMSI